MGESVLGHLGTSISLPRLNTLPCSQRQIYDCRTVLKVRNELDNNLYAIKKIKLRRLAPDSKVRALVRADR